jgi:hypothetical protein
MLDIVDNSQFDIPDLNLESQIPIHVLIGSNFLSLTFFSKFAIVIVRTSGQCCQVHIVCISHLTVIVKTIMFTVSLTFCIIW